MNHLWKFALILFLFSMASFVSAIDLEKERAAILQTDKEWSQVASEGKDVDRIVSFWSDDAMVYPPGVPAVVGKDAIRQFIKKSLEMPGFSIRWETSDVTVSQDGTLAYAIDKNQSTMKDSEGKLVTVHGKAVTIWRKEASGEWKCIIDIWNDDPTPTP